MSLAGLFMLIFWLMNTARLPRVASIDILRALTMVLMIFVNDLWTLKAIPEWLEHTAKDTDGMGLADVVFPAFLVIVGMSLPYAVDSRRRKGASGLYIFRHIAERSFALIVMGVFLVNGENINERATGMPAYLWDTFACLAFIFLYNSFPKHINKRIVLILKLIGWSMLILMAVIYHGGDNGTDRFSTYWWGILGLIGWAYFITASVFMLCGGRIAYMILFWLACIACSVLAHAGMIPHGGILNKLVSPFGQGAMPAFVAAGCISSLVFLRASHKENISRLIVSLLSIGAALILLGFYVRSYWGISKIRATPAWVLICSGITIAAFVLVYCIVDIKNKIAWSAVIRPAGTNTLLCYLLPYFAYALVSWLGIYFPDILLTGTVGLIKSFLFSVLIVNLSGLLYRYNMRLKL